MSDLISIVTPAYNAGTYIAETIDSVRAQTHQSWELLVVDDGSTDNTAAVVQQYCKLDARIKYIYQPNGRPGKARNNGIRHASGEYIAFIDADDLWLPEKLAIQLEQLKNEACDLVFSDSYEFSTEFILPDDTQKSLPKISIVPGVYAGAAGIQDFLSTNRIPTLTVLAKRSALVAVGGFTEDKLIPAAEDYHLWMKLLLEGYTLVGVSQALAAYRKGHASLSDVSGYNFRFVVEAKLDLAARYPASKEVILSTLTNTMVRSLPEMNTYSDDEFYKIIKRYLAVSGRQTWCFLFTGFEQLGTRKLALRSVYFIFNYL